MKKKTVRFTLLTNMVFGLLLLFGMSGAAADISYVYTDSKMLTKGVEFTSYDIFMSDRTWNPVLMSRRRICPSRILNYKCSATRAALIT